MRSNTQALRQAVQIAEVLRRRSTEAQRCYQPYAKQQQFHRQGVTHRERCLMAGNQTGKTYSGAMEVFFHLSGLYPEWWPGIRFATAPVVWVCGDTGETIRDTTQKLLFGRPGMLDGPVKDYTGIVPRRLLVGSPKPAMGVGNLFDMVKVQHASGGVSYCYFKAYAKGRKKFQGETLDFVWFDEEPPEDIYAEGLTRTNAGQLGQRAMLTFTPLMGLSTVVYQFLQRPSEQQIVVNMTIEDVDHYSAQQKREIIASYPEHEREARSRGIPTMGSGRVFPVAEAQIAEEPLQVPTMPGWWQQIAGIDFGWDHPTAAVWLLYDPEADVLHVHAAARHKEHTPVLFAAQVRAWGAALPFAWPHDGLQHDKGSGAKLADQYREAGLNMLPERATFSDGGAGVEAGIMELLERMQTGRLKVSRLLTEWWEEFRLYHRKDGKIVKERDDLLAATRYGLMMLRQAVPLRVQTPRSRAGGGRVA